jgi:branched-chain amino acid aminotransferase
LVNEATKIWFDGNFIPWNDAQVHVLTHSLHYGLAVFEGMRCYELQDGRSAIFRLEDHIRRLFDSARIMTLPMPWDQHTVVEACREVVRINGLRECYVRPLAFVGEGAMGLGARGNPTHVAIAAWEWGAYLGDEGLEKGIRAKVASFARPGVNAVMAKGKVVGHYVNSILAKREVLAAGYEEAIMLDPQGYVCEASGENLFIVRDGRVVTPPLGGSILGGITRQTVVALLGELGIPLEERFVARDELYIADEVFMCGTAAEVTPVRAIDDRTIGTGQRGPVTERVQQRYFQIVRGREVPHPEWLGVVS